MTSFFFLVPIIWGKGRILRFFFCDRVLVQSNTDLELSRPGWLLSDLQFCFQLGFLDLVLAIPSSLFHRFTFQSSVVICRMQASESMQASCTKNLRNIFKHGCVGPGHLHNCPRLNVTLQAGYARISWFHEPGLGGSPSLSDVVNCLTAPVLGTSWIQLPGWCVQGL